jgi:AsmA-like protein
MKKAPKIFLTVFAVLAAILITTFISLRIYFTPEKLGAITVSVIEKHVQRKVRVKSVSIGLGHLAIEGFAISEAPDFSKGEMFKAQGVRVWFEPLDLIFGELVIRTVQVNGASFTLIRGEDRKLNTADLLVPSESAKEPSKTDDAGDVGDSLKIRSLQIEESSFHYVDMPSKTDLLIDGISLSARNISQVEPFGINTSFSLHYSDPGKKFDLPVVIEGRLSPTKLAWADMSAKVDLLKITSGKMVASISGEIKNFTQPVGKISINTNQASSSELKALLPNIPMDITMPPVSVISDYKFGDSSLDLLKTHITADGIELVASGKISWLKGKGFHFDADLSSVNISLGTLASLTPTLIRHKIKGEISGALKLGYSNGRFANSGKVSLKKCGLRWGIYTFTGVDSSLVFSKNRVRADNLKGRLNNSPFTSSLSFYYSPTSTTTNLTLDLQKLNLKGIKVDGEDKKVSKKSRNGLPMNFKARIGIKNIEHDDFTGKDFTVSADIKNYTESMKEMGGTASFAIHGGKINSMSKGGHRSKALEVLMLPIMIVQKLTHILTAGILPDFDHVTYKLIEGDYKFTDGLMSIVKSDMDSSAAYVRIDGKIDLPPEKLDLKIHVSPGGVVGILQAPEFDVKGSISKPEVHYDPASIPTSLIKAPIRLLEKVFH